MRTIEAIQKDLTSAKERVDALTEELAQARIAAFNTDVAIGRLVEDKKGKRGIVVRLDPMGDVCLSVYCQPILKDGSRGVRETYFGMTDTLKVVEQ